MPSPIIVVGGGITGLAAAYELELRGLPFMLLESSGRLGGLILTERIGGYTIDSGAESMLVQKPAALDLCEELGLGPRLISSTPPRTAYVFARDRLHPLPSPSVFGIPTTERGLAAYDLLSPSAREAMRRLADAPADIGSDRARDESVADFFRRQFGEETVSLVAEPLLGGIHAGDVEQLSIASVAPRLVAAARQGHMLRGLEHAPAGAPTPPERDGLFRSLAGGMGELVDAIATRLPGGRIHVRSEVLSLSRPGTMWRVTTPRETFEAAAVIVAAPAHVAARLVSGVEPSIATLCDQTPYVSTVSVALGFPRDRVAHPLRGSGFVVARRHARLRITACTWVTSKWTNRAPAEHVLLRAFLGGATDPDAAGLTDAALIEIAARDVARVLGVEGAPHLAHVHRWLRAGAQHNVGHAARIGQIDALLARTPGLFVAGSGFRSIGIPDCISGGRAAAAAAAADYGKMPV
jgi:oxygen-dependent protoporphyrinogen oxidase